MFLLELTPRPQLITSNALRTCGLATSSVCQSLRTSRPLITAPWPPRVTGRTEWQIPRILEQQQQQRGMLAGDRSSSPTASQLPGRGAPFHHKRFRFLWHVRGAPNMGGAAVLPLHFERKELLFQSFQTVKKLGVEDLKKRFRIEYAGEEGVDSGGITKDWFLELSRHLFDPNLCLFCKHEDSGRGHPVYSIDPRSGVNPEHIAYFTFFGRILGKAIYDRHVVDAPLCTFIYRFLLGRPGTVPDLKELDPIFERSLRWMIRNDIDGVIEETFSFQRSGFGEQTEVEYVPGGSAIRVTNDNKREWIGMVVAQRTGGDVAEQLAAVKAGFNELIPDDAVRIFTATELDLLLNGKPDIPVEDIRAGTVYNGGFAEDSVTVVIFWSVMSDLESKDQHAIIRFATGATKIPLDGFDPPFTITRSEHPDSALPSSHTCFNQLVLPAYQTKEVLREKLLFASTNATGFQLT